MNMLLVKLSDGNTMAYVRIDDDYTDAATIVQDLVTQHHPSLTLDRYAIADCEQLDAASPADLDSNVGVSAKSAVPAGATIVAPHGVDLADIDDSEDVVYVTP